MLDVAIGMDDMTIGQVAVAPVPLPAAAWAGLALLGSSLAPAGLRRWRRRIWE